jgi:ribosomal protein S18 acetylase RimI-like enzyme
MLSPGRFALPGSSLALEIADPTGPELENLDLGDSYDGEMLTRLFARMAFGVERVPPTLFRFSTAEDETVGYAVIEDTALPFPQHNSATVANHVYIRLLGVVRAFQKRREPVSGVTYGMEVMRAIHELIVPHATDPVAVALTVRQGNTRARALYERMGYVEDTAGPFEQEDDWWLAMRRPLP